MSQSAAAQAKLGDPSGNANAPYWDDWFKKVSNGEAFEWYCDPVEVFKVMKDILRPASLLLHAGTGNSELMFDAVDVYPRAVCMDVSSVAIDEMNNKKKSKLPACENVLFTIGDVLDTLVPSRDLAEGENFDGVIDKGLFDAMMSSYDETYRARSETLFRNSHEVMKNGATYLCVTLAEEHVVKLYLDVLNMKREEDEWMWSSLSIRPISSSSGSLRPFVFLLQKGDKSPTVTFDGRTVENFDFETVNGIIESSRKAYMQETEKESQPMSLVTLEIKPYEADFDFDSLLSRLTNPESSPLLTFGASFKSHELVPLAFGIRKLELTVVVPTESVEDMCEVILEKEEEDVQSVDVDWGRAVPVMDAGRLLKTTIDQSKF